MALVAYSDESDMSGDEEGFSSNSPAVTVSSVTENNLPNGLFGGIDSIVDEDEDYPSFKTPGPSNIISKKVSLDSIPKAKDMMVPNDMFNAEDDELTDVPTKENMKYNKPSIAAEITSDTAKSSAQSDKISDPTDVPKLSKAMEFALGSSALSSLLVKKKGPDGKIQLLLPSLSELAVDEGIEEEMVQKAPIDIKPAPSKSGSGLFSLLPKPKDAVKGKTANRSLVPHILSNKKPQPPKSNIKRTPIKSSSKNVTNVSLTNNQMDSDEEDTNESTKDFFSLDDKFELPIVSDPNLIMNEVTSQSNNIETNLTSNTHQQNITIPTQNDPPNLKQYDYANNDDYHPVGDANVPMDTNEIDDEAWRRLTGKKRKRDGEVAEIIDINGDDALLSKEEWMLRSISEEKPQTHSRKKGDGPSSQQRKKHQITYLAHQAKEREIELKNDWSAERAKKLQARERYGF